MKVLVEIALFVWQLPQNLLGALLSIGSEKAEAFGKAVRLKERFFSSGVSLGKFIIMEKGLEGEKSVRHEAGHQWQSAALGPLYLIVVGIPSLARNVWDRLFHKDWTYQMRKVWYYSGWPESQADELGGVDRWA